MATIQDKLNSTLGFQKTGTTYFDKEAGFDAVIKNSGVIMNDDRLRMAKNENVLFGFIGAESINYMERLQGLIGTMSNKDLANLLKRNTDGLVYFGDTGCYFLHEQLQFYSDKSPLLLAGYNQNRLGFVSIRKDGTNNTYDLGKTSLVLGKRAFSSGEKQSSILITKDDISNDVFPGRLYLGDNKLDVEEIIINTDNSNSSNPEIDLKLTGEARQTYSATRGCNLGESFSKDYATKSKEFIQSQNPEHFYDFKAFLKGFNK